MFAWKMHALTFQLVRPRQFNSQLGCHCVLEDAGNFKDPLGLVHHHECAATYVFMSPPQQDLSTAAHSLYSYT